MPSKSSKSKRTAGEAKDSAAAEAKRCRCRIGYQRSDCPFSYANGWHEQRAEMLLRSEITPEVLASIEQERALRKPEDLGNL